MQPEYCEDCEFHAKVEGNRPDMDASVIYCLKVVEGLSRLCLPRDAPTRVAYVVSINCSKLNRDVARAIVFEGTNAPKNAYNSPPSDCPLAEEE